MQIDTLYQSLILDAQQGQLSPAQIELLLLKLVHVSLANLHLDPLKLDYFFLVRELRLFQHVPFAQYLISIQGCLNFAKRIEHGFRILCGCFLLLRGLDVNLRVDRTGAENRTDDLSGQTGDWIVDTNILGNYYL